MDIATAISIAISSAAFILSVIAIWQTHFAKFKIVCSAGNLRLQIYPFERHYLPCVDIPIMVTNVGAQAGKIIGIRVRVSFPSLSISKNYEFLDPIWDVDYKKYNPISNKRFEWIDKAVVGEWMPFVVLPKQTISKHLIFESKWDEPVFYDNAVFELEIRTSISRKWKKIARWNISLSPGMLDENIDSVSSFIYMETSSEEIERKENTELVELHNQINAEYRLKTSEFKEQSSLPPSRKKAKSRKKL
jgi:hypothetical protein